MVSGVGDHELDGIARTIDSSLRIRDPDDLDGHLERLVAAIEGETVGPRTVDLIGHSTTADSLLRLGGCVIDGADPGVIARFRSLANRGVVARLGIRAFRLLGCTTAGTTRARATIRALSDASGIEVFGTSGLLYDAHYDRNGFRDAWEFLLISSSELRRIHCEPRDAHASCEPRDGCQRRAGCEPPMMLTERWPCTLDLERLPAVPLGPPVAWPHRVATASAARAILALIRRDAGAPMPGPGKLPTCELALPSTTPGAYHIMHVLFDGVFVRCYPGGVAVPGIVYPVEDAPRLRRIIDELPPTSVDRRGCSAFRG
jgi:hypothetical protein